jgi:hypothetical protein
MGLGVKHDPAGHRAVAECTEPVNDDTGSEANPKTPYHTPGHWHAGTFLTIISKCKGQ